MIFGDHFGFINAVNHNGEFVLQNIFPIDTGGQIWGSPAAADMDGDGYIDIVIASHSNHLYIFDQNVT